MSSSCLVMGVAPVRELMLIPGDVRAVPLSQILKHICASITTPRAKELIDVEVLVLGRETA